MKILLIQPDAAKMMVGYTSIIRPEPLALEILAAAVPEHEVKILDLRVDPTLQETLASFAPDLVGVTGYTTNVSRMIQICRDVKSLAPETITVVGGYHATLCPEDFDYDFVDVIVQGEGETTFREMVLSMEERRDLAEVKGLILRLAQRQVPTGMRPLVSSMDSLPLPDRHLVDHYRGDYHFHFWDNPYLIETARGCPFRCNFCAVWKFHHGKCRFRSPELVLEDLKSISSRVVCFVDDNFFANLERAKRLGKLIKDAGIKAQYWAQVRSDSVARRPDIMAQWAKVGLDSVLIGLEKFRDDELASVNKRNTIQTNEEAIKVCHDNGVDVWGAFIVDPQWTAADFSALIDYVRSLKIYFPQYTILTPLPGTAFFKEKFQQLTTHNYEVYDFMHTVLPTKLPLEEFYANMARLYANTIISVSELRQRVRAGRIPVSSLKRAKDVLRDVVNPKAYLRNAAA